MSWSRFEPSFTRHPKRLESGVVACWLWICSVDHCTTYLTDGFVRASAMPSLSPLIQGRSLKNAVAALVACRAWESVPGGYIVHDYLKHHPSAAQVEAGREANRERYLRWRGQRLDNAVAAPLDKRVANAVTDAFSNAVTTKPRVARVSQSVSPIDSKPTTLSSDEAPLDRVNGFKIESREILDFLNRTTGHDYRHVPVNLTLIEARLKSGVTSAQLRAVIAMKARQWSGEAIMAKYLRPATLFNATKFEQYLGELPAAGHKPEIERGLAPEWTTGLTEEQIQARLKAASEEGRRE